MARTGCSPTSPFFPLSPLPLYPEPQGGLNGPWVVSHHTQPCNLLCPWSRAEGIVQAPDELARQNDSYALALQNRSVSLKSWSPQPSDAQASGHGSSCPALPEADPRPVPDRPIMGAQGGRQSPDEQLSEAQGRGQYPEGQVLEGQGRGLFLGPPAQRWAADSALKESMNR